jgi:serine protease Do
MTESINPRRQRPTRVILASLLSTTILAGSGFAWSSKADTVAAAPLALPAVANQAGFADLAAKVRPAVVNIATTEEGEQASARQTPSFPPGSPFGEMFRHNFDNQSESDGPRHALGSGFIIDPAGYIVTNNHVVDGARKITVTLNDGNSYPAVVKGRDTKTDLALLKIDAANPLPYVAFGASDKERVGDWVIAVGNPFGLGGTVTAGIVSAHGRDINEGPYDDFLQIDAPINPGNSGGPLFNQSGQVIGVDTAIYSPTGGSVGIGFAIPSDLAAKVVAQLREHGSVERGWLGVQMQSITPPLAKAVGRPNAEGVLVDQVEAASPAARADLRQGDVITAFNGVAVKSPRDLAMMVADTHSGSTAKLTVWRDGREQPLIVTIGTQSKEKTAALDEQPGGAPVGMALAPLSPDQRSALGLDAAAKGVVVARVTPDSRAAESGVRAGDVIVRIGSDAVTTLSEAADRIRAAEQQKKEAVPLLVMRDGTTYYLALQLAKG